MKTRLLVALAAILLASCASLPAPLQGPVAELTPRQAAEQGLLHSTVRWGGEIIRTEPRASTTCFEILARPLGSSGRPLRRDPAGGRFIACTQGFHDPEVYARGRQLTVLGEVVGFDQAKVGEFDYRYPHVEASAVHLWPELRPSPMPPPWYDPWYGYGPWAWGPYWGPGVMIHRGYYGRRR